MRAPSAGRNVRANPQAPTPPRRCCRRRNSARPAWQSLEQRVRRVDELAAREAAIEFEALPGIARQHAEGEATAALGVVDASLIEAVDRLQPAVKHACLKAQAARSLRQEFP